MQLLLFTQVHHEDICRQMPYNTPTLPAKYIMQTCCLSWCWHEAQLQCMLCHAQQQSTWLKDGFVYSRTCRANGFSALEVVGGLLLPGDLVLLQAGQQVAHDAGGVGLALHGQPPPPLRHQPALLCRRCYTALTPTCCTHNKDHISTSLAPGAVVVFCFYVLHWLCCVC